MISFKPGIRIAGVQPEIVLILPIIDSVFKNKGFDTIITELTGGKHSPKSLHYVGLAVDISIRNLGLQVSNLVSELEKVLGEDYDVVQEITHIHIEFQPKSNKLIVKQENSNAV